MKRSTSVRRCCLTIACALAAAGGGAQAGTHSERAKPKPISLTAPGNFGVDAQTAWRTLALAANARLSDPRVGLYAPPDGGRAPVLFVPDIGIAVAEQGPQGDCYGDTVRPPGIQSSKAQFAPESGGYEVGVSTSCESSRFVYPLVLAGRQWLLTSVDGYVAAFNATEGDARLEHFSLVKVAPLAVPAGASPALPAAVQSRLFAAPLTLKFTSVRLDAREINMSMVGMPPRMQPGYRITAHVDKGAEDRLFVGMQVWHLGVCMAFKVTQVDAKSATVEQDIGGLPSQVLADGDSLSTSRKQAVRAGHCP